MKKISIFLFGSLLCLTVPFITSCDENYPGPDPVDVTAHYSNKYSNPNPNLILTYSGEEMVGKSIDFSTVKGESANITLYDILPGEKTLKLSNIPISGDADGYTFKGNGTGTTTQSTFNYEGRVVKGQLTLSLTNVMMANADTWADTYKFSEVTTGTKKVIVAEDVLVDQQWETIYKWSDEPDKLLTAACYASMDAELSEDGQMASELNGVLQATLGYILPQVLQNVTLEADGNIIADYSADPLYGFDFSDDEHMSESLGIIFGFLGGVLTKDMVDAATNPEIRSYTPSPKRLAYWFQKDGHLILKLDLPNIISQVAQSSGKTIDPLLLQTVTDVILQMDAMKLKSQLNTINQKLNNPILSILVNMNDTSFKGIFNWLSTGITMNVVVKDGHTCIYLDKNELTPLFKLCPDPMPIIENMIPADMQMRDLIIGIVQQILTEWPEYCLKAKAFNIGLDFIPADK